MVPTFFSHSAHGEAVGHIAGTGAGSSNAAAVEALLTRLFVAFPDFWVRQHAVQHVGDSLIVDATFGGTHRGGWEDFAPTGNVISLASVIEFRVDGDSLVCEKFTFDPDSLHRQLSAFVDG
jgi:predicted ester cyclase